MLRTHLILAALAVIALPGAAEPQTPTLAGVPHYTDQGELIPPTGYREWIYLSTGMNMSYLKPAQGAAHDAFSNVFVNPEAFREFKRTGTWPDKTQLVLEVRAATSKGSINQRGFYQSSQVLGTEVHVKDRARFKGEWGFFGLSDGKPAPLIPYTAECYSCHRDHAAVDTTFVQFYPTLMPVAEQKGTLSAPYRAERDKPAAAN